MNKTFKLAALSAVSFALAACGGGGDSDDGGNGPVVGRNGTVEVGSVNLSGGQTCNIPGFAQALIAEINAARAQARNCGDTAMPAVPAIGYWNTRLTDAAVRHSTDMAAKGFLGHTGSDGTTPFDRVMAAGYEGGGSGEVAARMNVSGTLPNRVVQSWMASPSHCKILMDATHKEIGGACVQRGQGYVTTLFGY